MNRAIELTPASGKLLLVAACAAVLLLQGCATAKQAQEKPSSYPCTRKAVWSGTPFRLWEGATSSAGWLS